MKVLLMLAENSSKTEMKLFPLCAISHEFGMEMKNMKNIPN